MRHAPPLRVLLATLPVAALATFAALVGTNPGHPPLTLGSREPTPPAPTVPATPRPVPDVPPALRATYIAARQAEGAHDARLHARRAGAALLTHNDARGVTGRFDARGVTLSAPNHPALSGRLDVTELRCGDRVTVVGPATPRLAPALNRVLLERTPREGFHLREWWANGPLGLEQGFDIAQPSSSSSACDGELALTLATPGFAPSLNGDAVRLASLDGAHAFRYAELSATDADGRPLAARFVVNGAEVTLAVDTHGARFPIAIDPLLYDDEQRVGPTADGDSTAGDLFGASVALSDDTALVGAFWDDVDGNVDQGSAYVFVRTGSTWSLQAQLTATDGAATDRFGGRVALVGDTALVGAFTTTVGANPYQGAAYVFVRDGSDWTEQAKLIANDGTAYDHFGASVALSADTALVGAYEDDVDGNLQQGSSYVFVRADSSWSQQARLTATDGAAGDYFGYSVALSGDTALVGAFYDTVGANAEQGSAYVFVRTGSTWTQQSQLTANDGARSDNFGTSVAIEGDTALIGAYYDTIDVNSAQGSAYLFVREGAAWSQQARLTATGGATSDHFGISTALSGDTAVVGAHEADVGNDEDQGAAFVFVREGTSWSQQAHFSATDGAAGDHFGISVALSNNRTLIGAWHSDGVAPAESADEGAAYFGLLTLLPNGRPCTIASECLGGICVDGVCCDSACTGQCEACAEPGSEGVCIPVSGESRGDRETCEDCSAGLCVFDLGESGGCACSVAHTDATSGPRTLPALLALATLAILALAALALVALARTGRRRRRA